MVDTVETHYGEGGFNPLANAGLGWSFIVFQIFIQTAATLTWQAVTARLLSAKDTATGRKVFTGAAFFFFSRFLLPGLWGIAALTMLGWSPLDRLSEVDRAAIPAEVASKIEQSAAPDALAGLSDSEKASIPPDARRTLNDLSLHEMPRFLSLFVPIGLMGLLIATMLAADMSTDSSYMLTWASVIYNDILAPFRRGRVISEKQGLIWNRFIVAMIGVYLFFFGLMYKLEGDLWTYCTLTGSIYLASMSVLLIACCYWSRANSWGAAGAIVCGAVIPVAFLVLQKINPSLAGRIGEFNAGIAAYVIAGVAMIAGSMIRPLIVGGSRDPVKGG
jgi:SSS family solute:Na+ symporter